MTRTLVEVEHLSVALGGRLVVDDVSFAVSAGDFVTVIGPNGAGKSTLFAALLGLLPRSGGVVEGTGSYGFVPQHQHGRLDFPVTAVDVVLMGAYGRLRSFRRTPPAVKAEAFAALERVGLEADARKRFGALSGGQRQRVLLARALLQQGDVLLLDEVLAGVDAASEQAIVATLAVERAAGRAVVMAAHDLQLARSTSTSVLLLNRRSFGFGPPDVVLSGDRLRAAYGGRLLVLDADGTQVLDEGSHHDHAVT